MGFNILSKFRIWSAKTPLYNERLCLGVTLLEVLICTGLVSILTGIGISNLHHLDNESQNATAYVSSFIKQARARAVSSTLAYKIRPSSTTQLITETATTCTATTWTADPRNKLKLPDGTRVVDTTWDICFNSRGFPDGNLDILVRDSRGSVKKVEVMLGGATRVI